MRRIRTKTETAMMSRVGKAIRVRLIAKRNMLSLPSLSAVRRRAGAHTCGVPREADVASPMRVSSRRSECIS